MANPDNKEKLIWDITDKRGVSTAMPAMSARSIASETKKLINGGTLIKSQALGDSCLIGDVDTRLLYIDYAYQRITDKLDKLNSRYNPSRMGVIIASYRDGKLFVIDGAHRITASILHGINHVFCCIYTDLTQVDEAELFATQNDATVPLTGMERYEAELTYGAPNAVTIESICKLYSVEPCNGKYHCGLAPIKTLYNIVNQYEDTASKREILYWIMGTLEKMNWTQTNEGCSSYVLMAMKKIYIKGELEDSLNLFQERLVNVCKGEDPRETCLLGRLNLETGDDIRGWAMSELMGIAQGEITSLNIVHTCDTE